MNEEAIIREIKNKLDEIEEKEKVTILFAVESGSRAWGFASPDSDFDVRFIYMRNDINDYLKLEGIRDVIEWELNDVYDINGWDLDKTLKLVHKSNPVIFEWASSPIVYKETAFLNEFREFIQPYFMTIKGANHYLQMAKRNYSKYLTTELVKAKKYFYVLRPILAVKYVLHNHTNPPMLFRELIEAELDDVVRGEVEKLLETKINQAEKRGVKKNKLLNDYIEMELILLENEVKSLKKEESSWDELNAFFVETLNRYRK